MIRANQHYSKLQASYLFANIESKIKEYHENNPDASIIKLGIGDVTLPLPASCLSAFHGAVDEMGKAESFHGYGPDYGYEFLRKPIAKFDFARRGCDINDSDIFISDGAKCDTGNFQELFDTDITIAVPDPVYPVYVDTNVMAGRSGDWNNGKYSNLIYLESREENGFVPELPTQKADLIYLCFPNNPTGATATKEDLLKWVQYAEENNSLILFDAAYVSFIRDENIPRSIFEIPGAKRVAVEFRSFSKNAGFTGTRCAYTVISDECRVFDSKGAEIPLKPLWARRQSTKFNGVSYPVQKAAAAVYSKTGEAEVRQLTDYYLKNAGYIRNKLTDMGFSCTGGYNSPYIWVKGKNIGSWDFFDLLLEKAQVVTTPGAGFGTCGEGFIRISAFNSFEKVQEAMERLKATDIG